MIDNRRIRSARLAQTAEECCRYNRLINIYHFADERIGNPIALPCTRSAGTRRVEG